MNAPFGYPLRLDHLRLCPNGSIPKYAFAKRATDGLNHAMAHRRKSFATWGAIASAGRVVGATGTQTIWKFRCRTGYGATHLAFHVGIMPASFGNGGTDQSVEIDVVNGGTTTLEIRPGDRIITADGGPQDLVWRTVRAEVDPNTIYSVAVRKIGGARPVSFCAYEEASRTVDSAVDYYHALTPGVGEPVTDANRQRWLEGYAGLWKKNGSHLLSWLGTKDGTSPTVTGTTWTNVIDGTTAVAASSAGFYLGDGTTTLEQWCRLSDNKTIDIILAAYGSMSAGTGEVRLQNSGGTLCSLTGITTVAGWFTTTTTIAALDTVSKCDLQFRAAAGGNTLTLDAVDAYAYLT